MCLKKIPLEGECESKGKNGSFDNQEIKKELTDRDYWEMKEESTGERFDIPMLSKIDVMYRKKYISFMRLRVDDPAGFQKVMNWDW